ncbi:TPA: glycosyltransferase family 2 protein [Photobacterium damselae]
MNVYLAVVSHGHDTIINNIGCLKLLANHFNVVIKSNKSGDDLTDITKNCNVHWIDDFYGLGFGQNNNNIYNYCVNKLDMRDEDFFIVLNPDVKIDKDAILKLINIMESEVINLASINLYKNESKTEYDNSIRYFPTAINFIKSLLGLGNESIIDKSSLNGNLDVDWAAGSFLAFRSKHYKKLCGFDENYFMYCEDIDICYRSAMLNSKVRYIHEIEAIHFAQHNNRKLMSKHFFWHIRSAIRFLFSKRQLTTLKTSLH